MQSCPHCDGFVPAPARSCPNCQHALKPGRKRGLKRAFQLMLGASFSLTLTACYGAPPPQSLPPCDDNPKTLDAPCVTPYPSPSPSASASPSPAASPTASPSPSANP